MYVYCLNVLQRTICTKVDNGSEQVVSRLKKFSNGACLHQSKYLMSFSHFGNSYCNTENREQSDSDGHIVLVSSNIRVEITYVSQISKFLKINPESIVLENY